MAETIFLNIPEPGENENPAFSLNWYQSNDGLTWDLAPVDTILISDLTIDANKYKWTSLLANKARWHKIKTVSDIDVESTSGLIIPPRPEEDLSPNATNFNVSKISTGKDKFLINETVDLILEVESKEADIIGDEIIIHILDPFDNIISNITATRLGNLYLAQYRIPKNLNLLYNIYKEAEILQDYLLVDKWIFPDSSSIDFNFLVERKIKENPVANNSEIQILFTNILAADSDILDREEVKFTTKIDPFYCSVQDVIDIAEDKLGDIDPFLIAREILTHSKQIDYLVTPDTILYKDRFEFARSNLVAYEVAQNLLESTVLNVSSEERSLDTFINKKEYSYDKGLVRQINEHITKYSNIVYAGGKDTIFTTKTFIKGINDPNRLKLTKLDSLYVRHLPYNKSIPYNFNYTKEDGSVIELRGIRSIAESYNNGVINDFIR